jgi:hypothetical protein
MLHTFPLLQSKTHPLYAYISLMFSYVYIPSFNTVSCALLLVLFISTLDFFFLLPSNLSTLTDCF